MGKEASTKRLDDQTERKVAAETAKLADAISDDSMPFGVFEQRLHKIKRMKELLK